MPAKLNEQLLHTNDGASSSNESFWQTIQNAAKKFMHYASLTCMFVLPSFFEQRENGFAILYLILTLVSFSVLLGTAVQKFHIGSIKIWPKILDVGTFAVNLGLLIYTQTSGKSALDLTSFCKPGPTFCKMLLFSVLFSQRSL